MDSIDKQILWTLIQNCRISIRNLSKTIDLSPSSIKKRIDNLEQSGFIDHFMVALDPNHINTRYATLMVFTDASVKIPTFGNIVTAFDGVYMILPLIDGNFYVSLEYSKETDLKEITDLIFSIQGVTHIDEYDVLPKNATDGLPEAPEFSRSELVVLGQLAKDARMLDYVIATNIGWSTKKTKQVLQKLETEVKVAFGARWNPNKGRDIAFNIVIKYYPEKTVARDITTWLEKEYPIVYVNSRVVESKSTLFAVFTIDRIVDLQPIVTAVLDRAGIQSCYAITYYDAIVGKTLSRLRLERILEKEGLWPPKDK